MFHLLVEDMIDDIFISLFSTSSVFFHFKIATSNQAFLADEAHYFDIRISSEDHSSSLISIIFHRRFSEHYAIHVKVKKLSQTLPLPYSESHEHFTTEEWNNLTFNVWGCYIFCL